MSKLGKTPSPITTPTKFFIYIAASLVLVSGLVFSLRQGIASRFFALGKDNFESAFINGFILLVLGIGILFIFVELFNLNRQVRWLKHLQNQTSQGNGRIDFSQLPSLPNQMLAPVQSLFTDRSSGSGLNTQSSKAVVDAISGRIEERRELSRWIIQTLILTGLIGTFWGLFGTITQIGSVIGSLQSATAGNESAAAGFADLIENLQPVLASMGVAFSSSLLGLAGSLLLGFIELQAGAAQNRFLEELEDWLYSITTLNSGFAVQTDSENFDHAAAAQQTLVMLESVSASMDRLRSSIVRTEEDRAVTNRNIVALSERIRDLAERYGVDQTHLAMLSQNAANFGPLIERLSTQSQQTQAQLESDRVLGQNMVALVNAIGQQTQELKQLSDRDAQTIAHQLGQLAQVTQQSADMNAERIERAIQSASQED